MKIVVLFLIFGIVGSTLASHPVRSASRDVSSNYVQLLQQGYDEAERFIDEKMIFPSCLRVWVKSLGDSAIYYFLNCSVYMKEGINFGTSGELDNENVQAILIHELGHALFTMMSEQEGDSSIWGKFKSRRRIERLALYNKRRMSELKSAWSAHGLPAEEKAEMQQQYRSLRDDPVMEEYQKVRFRESEDKSIEMLMTPYTELFADLFAVAVFGDKSIMQRPLPVGAINYPYRTFAGEALELTGWNLYGSYSMFAPVKRFIGAHVSLDLDFVVKFRDILDQEMNYICSRISRYPKAEGHAFLRDNLGAFLKEHGLVSRDLNQRIMDKIRATKFYE